MQIQLPVREYEYLINSILNKQHDLISKITIIGEANNNITISIEEDLSEDIYEIVTDRIDGSYFDDDGNPNEEGWILEHFIDKFYVK